MSLLPFLLATSNTNTFSVSHSESWATSSVSSSNDRTNVALGIEDTTRVFYLLIAGRTNTTTGARRFTGASIITGVTTYTGTIVAQYAATEVVSPIAIFKIAAPTGTTGTLRFTVSGNTDGLVSAAANLYSVIGTWAELSSTAGVGTTASVTGAAGGVILHQAYAAADVAYGGYTIQDQDATANGLSSVAGRIFPSINGTTNIVSTNGARYGAILLGAA